MRLAPGGQVRAFNGRDGEWLGAIDDLGKKGGSVVLREQILKQPVGGRRVCLLFAPIRKQRLDFLIEKAVELGVTDLCPVITARTENRFLKSERMEAQIIEAAEQCERLTLPTLHAVQSLERVLRAWEGPDIHAALERRDLPLLESAELGADCAFLIGPEGGFDEVEVALMCRLPCLKAISLGDAILRAETAALYCLSLASSRQKITKL